MMKIFAEALENLAKTPKHFTVERWHDEVDRLAARSELDTVRDPWQQYHRRAGVEESIWLRSAF